MILINSKATQIQYRPHILGYSIAGKLGYSLKILLTAQYNQEKVVAIIRESTTAWKTLPQTPLLSVLRTRRLPFSSIVLGLLPSPQARWCAKHLKIIPLEKLIGDDITYSYIVIRAEDGRRFYWNQDESLSDLIKKKIK